VADRDGVDERMNNTGDGPRWVGHRHGRCTGRDVLPPDRVVAELDLRPGDVLLDVGCGEGDISLPASDDAGLIYAIDHDARAVELLGAEAIRRGIMNIVPLKADLLAAWPIREGTVDIVLIANILHGFSEGEMGRVIQEAVRVLRPTGRVAVVEFRREKSPAGPSLRIRLEPDRVMELLEARGLLVKAHADVGPHHYMIKAMKRKEI